MQCIIYKSKTCRECYALDLQFNNIKAIFPQVEFIQINVDQMPNIVKERKLLSLPAIELYKQENLIAEFKHGRHKTPEHVVNFLRVYTELGE